MSLILRETKTDKMSKMGREMAFLERGMQTVRTKPNRLQKDLTQMPSTSTAGICPRQLLEQDYHDQ